VRSAAAAEWILSLVTPPERAASTVGDLLEQRPARGTPWFWSNVLRTACSHIWRDLSSSPRQMMWLAFWGWLANWEIGALLSAGYVLAPALFLHVAPPPPWFHPVFTVMLCTIVPFLAGSMVARRSEGHELAAVFSVVSLMAAFQIIRIWCALPAPQYESGQFCALVLFMAAGAIHIRRSLTPRGSPAR
jgi:hypothetical protein